MLHENYLKDIIAFLGALLNIEIVGEEGDLRVEDICGNDVGFLTKRLLCDVLLN